MAHKLITFDSEDLNIQFGELLNNLSPENFKENNPMVRSDSGKLFVIEVDDSGTLSTREV